MSIAHLLLNIERKDIHKFIVVSDEKTDEPLLQKDKEELIEQLDSGKSRLEKIDEGTRYSIYR